MKIEISEWSKNQKIITIISGFIFIVGTMIRFFRHIFIPGVEYISLAIFLLGIGLGEINLFKHSNKKSDLILSFISISMFVIYLYMGIVQIQSIFEYSIKH